MRIRGEKIYDRCQAASGKLEMLQISEAAKSIQCDARGASGGKRRSGGIEWRKGEKITASGRDQSKLKGKKEDSSLVGGWVFWTSLSLTP